MKQAEHVAHEPDEATENSATKSDAKATATAEDVEISPKSSQDEAQDTRVAGMEEDENTFSSSGDKGNLKIQYTKYHA